MAEDMPIKTVCSGRYDFDIPSNAKFSIDALYHGIRVDRGKQVSTFDDISRSIEARANKYHDTKSDIDPRVEKMLRAGGADPADIVSATQLVGVHTDPAQQQAIIAYHVHPDSLAVVAELHAFIDTHDWVFILNNTSAGDFARDSAAMTGAVNRFKPISKQMTESSGFCVMGGVFTDPPKPEIGEGMTLVVNDPSHKDMDLTIESNDFSKPSRESFSEEVDRDIAILKNQVHDLKILNRSTHAAAGQEGHLVAITGTDPDLGGARFYKYYWSAAGVPNNVIKPSLSVELVTHAASVSEESFKDVDDVANYFDRILEGIHERLGSR